MAEFINRDSEVVQFTPEGLTDVANYVIRSLADPETNVFAMPGLELDFNAVPDFDCTPIFITFMKNIYWQ